MKKRRFWRKSVQGVNYQSLYLHLKPAETLLVLTALVIVLGLTLCISAACFALEYSDITAPVKGLSFWIAFELPLFMRFL